MNIELKNYYVNKVLNTVFSLTEGKNEIEMVLPHYTKD